MGASDPAWTAPASGTPQEGFIIRPDDYWEIGAGTWARSVTPAADYGFLWFNSSIANLDNISYAVFLTAGTWTMKILTSKSTNWGILDIDIDGVEKASHDLYNSPGINNQLSTTTGIVISTTGEHELKLRADGKNGSSSDYVIGWTWITFERTA